MPATPRTAHTQGTGSDNTPWRATAAYRVECVCVCARARTAQLTYNA